MATLPIPMCCLLFSIILFLFPSTISTTPVCVKQYCGNSYIDIPIEFPFLLKQNNDDQTSRCGYPGFEVFCNKKNQALLKLPREREFVVITEISLVDQRVFINDPNECLPRRFLQNINLNDSPFHWDISYNLQNVTFLNCTKGKLKFDLSGNRIPCLSNDKYSIIYTLNSSLNLNLLSSSCHEIGFAWVPILDHSQQPELTLEELQSGIALQWYLPQCRSCEMLNDQHCGFSADTGLDVTCYNNHNFTDQGWSPPTPSPNGGLKFYPLVLGISALILLFWVVIAVVNGKRHNPSPQRQTRTESNARQAHGLVLGLEESRIEQYPKIQLVEQLPKSIDNVCSICLSEYEAKEILRSMPLCNHYFHVDCIDKWLKMNATCPLCRTLPEGSSRFAHLLLPATP